MAIIISRSIREKLESKHQVSCREVEQCFDNRTAGFLEDTREDHKSDPATLWFIAPTNRNRLLKVCFVPKDGNQFIRTAYPPNEEELDIYIRYA